MLTLCSMLMLLAQGAQPDPPRGAQALGAQVEGLGVSARVLMIGAHPDDEDTRLIAFLARGRHVRTAYLSLTRGDGGQNLIGNELGEALGVIRTEELLAARRVDGAEQRFARAYDFGFSKSAEETFRHWPRDTLLGDVVRVVRELRPHVIVAVFTGTPRDGHGHHQASGILAREAWDAAADTARFPAARFGPAWSPLKLYQGAYFVRDSGVRYDVGEHDPILGRSHAELAAISRTQHKSQAFGSLPRKGPSPLWVIRERSRVNAATPATAERSIFDGIDTTYGRLAAGVCPADRPRLDSAIALIARIRREANLFAPEGIVPALGQAHAAAAGMTCSLARGGDVATSLGDLAARLRDAWVEATGLAIEATVPRDVVALGDTVTDSIAVYVRGRVPVRVALGETEPFREVAPGGVLRGAAPLRAGAGDAEGEGEGNGLALAEMMEPPWLGVPRTGDVFAVAYQPPRAGRALGTRRVRVEIGGRPATLAVPIVQRFADPVKGEIVRPLAFAPAVSVTLDRETDYARAATPLVRQLRVQLRSAATAPREVRVSLRLPRGLAADSATRTVTLPAHGSVRTVSFTLRGQLPPGRHEIAAVAESDGETYARGYAPIEYEHIRPQRLYRPSTMHLEAVDVRLPPDAAIAYIQGVGDNSAALLQQLGLRVTLLDPADIPRTELARFTAVVVGTRAYESSEALVANNAALLEYVRRGGTMVVQYGQYEMTRPGMMPYPITLGRPADRVTDESSPVRIVDPGARVLTYPNAITAGDFEGWVQDRSLYMPRTFDPAYRPVIETADPGERPNAGGILVARYGSGTYVYTTLAFFRQLPAGVPGAARLFVNLLAAGAAGPPRAQ